MGSDGEALPTLSAVIPTNRPLARIRPTLDAVLRDDAVIEVLLAVDGPDAPTLGPELDALDAATPRLRVLRLPEHAGAELARHIAAEAALGDIVWFVDDDVLPAPDSGARHVRAHAESGAELVVGRLVTATEPDAGVPARLYEEAFSHEWARFLENPDSILQAFWSGHHSVRRSALLGLDVNPPVFRYTYHSDRAFGLMASRAGWRAVAVPGLVGTHRYAPTLERWRRECRRQGVGRVEIHRAFGDVLGPDADNPWASGLGRRGRAALRLAQLGPSAASAVAGGLARLVRVAARFGKDRAALEFARVLRSVEQFRGAQAAGRGTDAGLEFIGAPPAGGQPHAGPARPAPADVTLLVVSRGPSAQLRRVLEAWRPHVAEVVVVADLGGEAGLAAAVADLADRTATVESAFPIESVLERCWPLCRRAFVFRGDDDEVPSTVLLAELRSLTLDPTLQQAGIPMRWTWPDERTWIAGYPWTANPQPKLIRNLAGQIHFPGRVHTAEHLDLPIRAVNLPIYHLRTLDPVDERRARIARYVGVGGGSRHFDGRPANSQYLPEDVPGLRLNRVPAWDAGAVGRVAEAGFGRHGSAAAPVSAGTGTLGHAAETVVLGDAARFPESARRVSVRLAGLHPPVAAGGRVVIEVVIANRSDTVLPGGRDETSTVFFSTRWRPADGRAGGEGVVVEGQRLGLGESLPPGKAVLKVFAADIPAGPGRWRVAADLVEEGVAWFGDGDEFTVDVPRAVLPIADASGSPAALFGAIEIESQSACNRRCWFCKFGQERQDDVVRMDWDTIRRIVGNLGDLDYRGRISWYVINEPLVDTRIVEIVALTREACPAAFLSLATNGDLLTEELYGRLKGAGLDALGVTVYDDDTLARVSPFADSRLTFIDMRNAGSERLENRAGNVQRKPETFQAQQWMFADQSCERPFLMMAVKATGQAVLCCDDLYGDVVMGDVRDERLEDIWRGERYARYRRTLAATGRRGLPLCEQCSYSGQGVKLRFPLDSPAPAAQS